MRGYQKRIIHLKHTGSHLFDEAYFVISSCGEKHKDSDMISEANRIIEDSIGAERKFKRYTASGFLYPFLLGAAVSVICFSAVLFLVYLI